MRSEVFKGTFTSWEALFEEAAAFATRMGAERVISISHSCDQSQGVVVVWYWGDLEEPEEFDEDVAG